MEIKITKTNTIDLLYELERLRKKAKRLHGYIDTPFEIRMSKEMYNKLDELVNLIKNAKTKDCKIN